LDSLSCCKISSRHFAHSWCPRSADSAEGVPASSHTRVSYARNAVSTRLNMLDCQPNLSRMAISSGLLKWRNKMAKVKCKKCGKEFGTEHALKVHMGLQHGAKRKAGRRGAKARRQSKVAKGPRKGKFVCPTCGRSFKMAPHLARHQAAMHGIRRRTKKAVGGRARGVVRARASSGIEVDALPVDQLLALKREVDARLTEIVQQMRRARVKV